MEQSYSAFGLRLRLNMKIPGLTSFESNTDLADVNIHLGIAPQVKDSSSHIPKEPSYVSSYTGDAGQPALQIWRIAHGEILRLDYFDGVQFWLDRKGKNVWATWPDTLKIEDAASYLLGPVLGLLLRFRGVTCLHASAVVFDSCAVAFVGPEGAGKSTTAAALAHRGHPVLSDDIVALASREGALHVLPAYRQLWLWPDSVEAIFGSPEAIPRYTPNYEKRCVNLGTDMFQFEEHSLPVKAIYLLGERKGEGAPCAEPVAPQDALVALVANTYATNILDRDMRAMEFEALGRVVSAVPIRRVHPHQDSRLLDELCQLILRDLQSH